MEDREAIVTLAWKESVKHLRNTLGADPKHWQWGSVHILTHGHSLGQQSPLGKLFNVGGFPSPGGHETPNNLSPKIGSAPWPVVLRLADWLILLSEFNLVVSILLAKVEYGVWLDQHYQDNAQPYIDGVYYRQ